MNSIKVALIEDDPIWRECLTAYLKEEGIHVVDVAESKEEGRVMVQNGHFDVLLLDMMLAPPDLDGLDLARELSQQQSLNIIMLTSVDEAEWVGSAIDIGVKDYVIKSCYQDLPFAIRNACLNEGSIHPHAMHQLRREIDRLKRIEEQWVMTPGEREVLQLIERGYTRREIMQTLYLSENTVKSYIFRINKKFRTHSSKEAARYAKRKGWLS
jgi:DNA-binding NarL/FixJ family response regulator